MKLLLKITAGLMSLMLLASCGSAKTAPKEGEKGKVKPIAMKDNTVIVIRCGDFDLYERTLVVALQGIVNRDGPKVFLYTEKTSWINEVDRMGDGSDAYEKGFTDKYFQTGTEGALFDDMTKIYGLEPKEATLNEAIETFKEKFAGLIDYDISIKDKEGKLTSNPGRTNAVITAAGVYTCLPVTNKLIEKYSALSQFETLINMKNKFTGRLQATNWAVDVLLEKCSTEFVSSYFNEGEGGTYQNDYAVMNSAFCYELAAILPENLDHVLSDSAINADIYDPTEAGLLDKILDHVDDFGYVWGWGLGGENGQASAAPLKGLVLVCANMANGSFYAQLKPQRTDWQQAVRTDKNSIQVEDKFYIAFMTNEGDSFKAMASLQNHASWKQNARGDFPISWGMDPLVFNLFPSLADYYYGQATEKDSFFFAAAGYGYIHPYYLPVEMQDGYANLIKENGQKYGVNSVDIWWFTMLDADGNEIQWDWLKKTGMTGLTLWNNDNKTTFEKGSSVIRSALYYTDEKVGTGTHEHRAGVVAEKLKAARAKMGKKTYCTVIYGGTPEYFYDIYKNLPADDFTIVSVEELHAIAQKTGSRLSATTAEIDFTANAGSWDPTTQQ